MTINKKLIHFERKSDFNDKLANNEILDTSIVFIKDSQEIWTHSKLYHCANDSQSKISIVNHGSSDTNFTLTAGVLHKWSDINNLTLNIPEDVEGTREEYSVVFSTGDDFSLTIPARFRWQNSTIPTFEPNKEYELNIRDGKVLCSMFDAPPPSGEFLTYIENDGSDYILTDIMIDSNMYGISYKAVSLLDVDSAHHILVADSPVDESAGTTSCRCWFINKGDRYIYWSGTNTKIGSYAANVIYEDSKTGIQNNITPGYPLIIFAGKDSSGDIKYNGTFRIFNIKLLDANNNALVDLRPFRKDNGVIGLLDTVNNKFYTSVNGNLIGVE